VRRPKDHLLNNLTQHDEHEVNTPFEFGSYRSLCEIEAPSFVPWVKNERFDGQTTFLSPC
jgi:hypothetical protein